MGGARSLIVGEEEDLILFDGAADGAAELVLVEGGAGGVEVASCVESGVAEELKGVAVKMASSGLADDGDDAAVVVAVLGIEVGGEDAKLFDGVEVRKDGGATVHVLLNVDSIDHEAIGGFALAVDGEVAGVRVAGRIDAAGDARHDDGAGQQGRDRGHAGLDCEQIGVAAAVQRERGHLRSGDDLAQMSRGCFDLRLRRRW